MTTKAFLLAGIGCKKISARKDNTRIRTATSNRFDKQLSERITEQKHFPLAEQVLPKDRELLYT